MSRITTLNFDNAADWTFDSSKVEFVASKAQLKLQNNPGQLFNEPFASDVGFTYDNTKVEFTGGLARQKAISINENYSQPFTSDVGFVYNSSLVEFASGLARQKSQRPTDATFGATFTTDIDGSWGDGVLTGTAIGSAAVSGGRLDLAHNDVRGVRYSSSGNIDNLTEGTVKFKVTPNYSGAPTNYIAFFSVVAGSGSPTNSITLWQYPSGDLWLQVVDSAGITVVAANFGTWAPVSGTTYEFATHWQLSVGDNRLFINGTQFGTTNTQTGSITALNYLKIGSNFSDVYPSNFYVDDFIAYSSIQYISNYTPGYTLPEKDYLETVVQCPIHSYLYNIASFGAPTITEVNSPKYILNGYYWNGAAWVASSDTYATAMSAANWVTNIATFPGAQFGTGATVKVIFQSSNTLSSIDSIAFTIAETTYLGSNIICPEMVYTGSGTLISFDDFLTTESNTPKYTLQIGRSGNYLYWNGSAWVVSNGTYAQATDKTTFVANCSSLPILGQIYGQFKIHFNDGNIQQSISDLTADLTAQIYPITDEAIESNDTILSDSYIDFDDTIVTPVNTDIGWVIKRKNGNYYYHNGSAWVVSTKSIAQSNTVAEINAKVSSIIATGELYEDINIVAILHSDGSATPQAEDISVTYSYYSLEPVTPIPTSVIYFYVHDLLNEQFENAELHVSSKKGFFHTERLIAPFEQTAQANSEGYMEIEVIETTTVGKKLEFKLTYTDPNTNTEKSIKFQSVMVPNQALTKGTDILVVK